MRSNSYLVHTFYKRLSLTLLLLFCLSTLWPIGSLTAAPAAQAPKPLDDSVTVDEDNDILIDVLANDSPTAGKSLILGQVSTPSKGSVEIVYGQIRYTPKPNQFGFDQFFYTVNNGSITSTRQANVEVMIKADNNDPPTAIILSSQGAGENTPAKPLAENAPLDSVVGFLRAVDPDLACNLNNPVGCSTSEADNTGFLFTQIDQLDHFLIESSGDVALLRVGTSLVGGNQSTYTINVRVRDPENNTFTQTVTVQMVDTNDPPTKITLSNDSVDENKAASTEVGLLGTVDVDHTGEYQHTYTLVDGSGGADNDSFTISGRKLLTAKVLDFETKPIKSIRIRTTDPDGAFFEQIFFIKVNNLQDAAGKVNNLQSAQATVPHCTGDPITLIKKNSSNSKIGVLVMIDNITISKRRAGGCTVKGKINITSNGSTQRGLDFTGKVNRRNEFSSSSIENFKISLAGLSLVARNVEIVYISGRPTLHITRPKLRMPNEFGGLSALVSVPTAIDSGGVKFGTGRFKLPTIRTKSGFAMKLTGSLRKRGNRFVINADGQLTIPNIKASKKSRRGKRKCTIGAGVTISTDVFGRTTLSVAAGKALYDIDIAPTVANAQRLAQLDGNVASRQAAERRLKLSAVRASASCDPGLPIANTGLFLTSVSGKVTIIPGREKVDLEVEIEAGKSLPALGPIVSAQADMSLRLRPFRLDLGGTIKVLIFKMARADATIVKNGFRARIRSTRFAGPIPYTTNVRIAAFTKRGGKFTFVGSGRVAIEMKKGALGKKCVRLIFRKRCVSLPPFSFNGPSARVEAGEFTNGNFGFKGVVSLGRIKLPFGIGRIKLGSRGFFVNEKGRLTFRRVSRFRLIKPPFLRAARAAQENAQRSAAFDGVTFMDDVEGVNDTVIIDVPLTKPMVDLSQQTARTTAIISQVNLIQHGDVLFNLVSSKPLTLSLITPKGDEVTSDNYSAAVGYNIEYSQYMAWGEENNKDENTKSDFVEPDVSQDEDENPSAKLLFTAVSSDPSMTGLDLKINNTVVYYDLAPNDTVWLTPISLLPGTHSVQLLKHGTAEVVLNTSVALITDTKYSLISYGGATTGLHLFKDDNTAPNTMGKAKIRFVNAATPNLSMKVNGTALFSGQARLSQSDYALVDAGDVTIDLVNSSSGQNESETLSVTLVKGGIYTFFGTDDVNNSSSGKVTILQRQDATFAPLYITTYSVDQATMNEKWQTKLVGDTENNAFELSVDSPDSAPILGSVSVNATNLADTKVSWQLTTDINPTTITVYINPGDIQTTSTVTLSDGTTDTATTPLYEGELLAEYTITDLAELGGQLVTKSFDLSGLESGSYHLWVRADDGLNEAASSYAATPSARAAGVRSVYGTDAVWLSRDDYNLRNEVTNAAAIVIDQSASFPANWSATITPTFNATSNSLDVEWNINRHPDVDLYRLLFGHTPLSPTEFITVGNALAVLDENDKDTGRKIGFQQLTNISPDTPYYISIEAINAESGRSVRSQEVEFSVPSTDFTLTTQQSSTGVTAGNSVDIPITLNADEALFFPNVWLSANLGETPFGITAGFKDDVEGFPGLNSGKPTRMLAINVDASVPAGTYPIVISGYNGEKKEFLSFNLVVRAAGGQPTNIFLPLIIK